MYNYLTPYIAISQFVHEILTDVEAPLFLRGFTIMKSFLYQEVKLTKVNAQSIELI